MVYSRGTNNSSIYRSGHAMVRLVSQRHGKTGRYYGRTGYEYRYVMCVYHHGCLIHRLTKSLKGGVGRAYIKALTVAIGQGPERCPRCHRLSFYGGKFTVTRLHRGSGHTYPVYDWLDCEFCRRPAWDISWGSPWYNAQEALLRGIYCKDWTDCWGREDYQPLSPDDFTWYEGGSLTIHVPLAGVFRQRYQSTMARLQMELLSSSNPYTDTA